MAFLLSPIANDQQMDANGAPLSGGTISTYLAGSSTPAPTYTDITGVTPQTNPIVLTTLGAAPSPIWLDSSLVYKFIIKDSLGNLQRTIDNVSGISSSVPVQSQWVVYGAAPTYLSTTSLSLPGDQTSVFQVGRRINTTNTGGVVYSTILTSSFSGGITTITLNNDSGTLDSGLSQLSYGLLSPNNPAIPAALNTPLIAPLTLAGTAIIFASVSVAANATSSNIWVSNRVMLTGAAVNFTNFTAAPQAGAWVELYCNAAHVFTPNANFLIDGLANLTATPGDRILVRAKTTTVFELHIMRANGSAREGEIFDWAGNTTPPWGLLCNGAAVSRTTYASLFAAIGTIWGAGDGSTTFNLPNIPADYTTVMASGNEGTTTAGQVIAHTHTGGMDTSVNTLTGGPTNFFVHQSNQPLPNTGSTGGSANVAAGIRVRKCIRF